MNRVELTMEYKIKWISAVRRRAHKFFNIQINVKEVNIKCELTSAFSYAYRYNGAPRLMDVREVNKVK